MHSIIFLPAKSVSPWLRQHPLLLGLHGWVPVKPAAPSIPAYEDGIAELCRQTQHSQENQVRQFVHGKSLLSCGNGDDQAKREVVSARGTQEEGKNICIFPLLLVKRLDGGEWSAEL
jgi:hypothetical protein